jgi:hypothetical protein
MANILTLQTHIDGDKNVLITAVGVLDTANLAKTTVVDVSALVPAATAVAIEEIEYSVSSQLSVQVYWDSTADDLALALTGQGEFDFCCCGGLQNPKAAGFNGDVLIETTGWASGIQTFTLSFKLKKQGVDA